MAKLEHECAFCAAPTNFKDGDTAYCIDCYVKIRNSSHTHPLPVNPWPVTPLNSGVGTPGVNPNIIPPYRIGDFPNSAPIVIC